MAVFSGNGSAASPSFTFSSDTNIGMYRVGTDSLGFATAGTNALTILDSQKLIVGGTTSISTPLSSSTLGGSAYQQRGVGQDEASAFWSAYSTTTTVAPNLVLGRSRGSLGAQGLVLSGDTLGRVSFQGSDGQAVGINAGFIRGAEIEAQVDGTAAAGAMPTCLIFRTTPAASPTPNEVLRLDRRGNMFLNNATATGTIWDNGDAVFEMGFVGTNGSYGMDIVGNGYRDTSGTWTSLNQNSQTGRTIISLRPDGNIYIGADNLSTGTQPTIRGGFTNAGEFMVGGTFPSSPNATISASGSADFTEVRVNGLTVADSTGSVTLAANGTLDFTLPGATFVGTLYVTAVRTANAAVRTVATYFVTGRLNNVVTITQLNTANGSTGGSSFTITNNSTASANILRFTDTAGQQVTVSMAFVGTNGL